MLLACACAISAQTVSADKLLKQAAQTLGDEKAFKAITTRQASGTFTQRSDGRSGRIQIHLQRPNFYLKTTELDGFETAEAYSGKSSWQRNSRHGLRTRVGQDSFDFQFVALFHNQLWFDAKSNKVQIVSGGQDVTIGENDAADLLAAAEEAGSPAELRICEEAGHAESLEACPEEYPGWMLGFLERVLRLSKVAVLPCFIDAQLFFPATSTGRTKGMGCP
jgi:hypothetical protein